MEQKIQKLQRGDLQNIILSTVAVAGVIAVGLLAPNALGAMAKLGLIPGPRQREIINASRARLVARGLLKYEHGKLRLTPKGKAQLRRLRLLDYKLKKPKRWDKKWRVLIFDIPERRKVTRNRVRAVLSRLGFERLQDSVWVYPYDCEDVLTLLKADLRVGKDMLYMVVDSIEYDGHLRARFALRS
ncbi:MAG TPA: CRISPR-associated endonuclease Cas2 [Candidatus Paceibacterota bacterium]